jgi:2-keto-4-pentenoate hydratase
LRAGEKIITGAIIQVPIAAGNHVEADFGAYGQIAVELKAQTSTTIR